MNIAKIQGFIPHFLLPSVRYIYCLFQEYRSRIVSEWLYGKEKIKNVKPCILIYGVSALAMGWTEKNLQMIAKHLDREKYAVFLMYGTKPRKLGNYNSDMIRDRRGYLGEEAITYIPFTYDELFERHPYGIKNMSPHIVDTLHYYNIDLVITAWAGNAEFPLTSIECPIIFLNIFGIPNTIKNIKYHVCISQTIANEISDVVPAHKVKPLYIPTEWPINITQEDRINFRENIWLTESDIVFGRIWRADDSIHDPIGILAFERVVQKYPHIHYVIVSPSSTLRKYVQEKKIPNVHLLDPIYDEKQVWIFHKSIDVLAHFRYDGETFGLNIAESMMCGNPIITHKSKIWNAHLEYLTPENSFIADIDNIDQYTHALEFFAKDKEWIERKRMGLSAKETAERLFHIDSYMGKIDELIQNSLSI